MCLGGIVILVILIPWPVVIADVIAKVLGAIVKMALLDSNVELVDDLDFPQQSGASAEDVQILRRNDRICLEVLPAQRTGNRAGIVAARQANEAARPVAFQDRALEGLDAGVVTGNVLVPVPIVILQTVDQLS